MAMLQLWTLVFISAVLGGEMIMGQPLSGSLSGIFNTQDSAPFISLFKRDTTTDTQPSTAKTILEWVFAVATLSIIFLSLLLRYLHLRTQGQSVNNFFSFMEAPRSPRSQFGILSHQLSPVTVPPGAHLSSSNRNRTSVRGSDTDMGGRRAGGRDPDDSDFDNKELLPAYDKQGGPPGYLDLELRRASIRLTGVVESSPPPTSDDDTQTRQEDVPGPTPFTPLPPSYDTDEVRNCSPTSNPPDSLRRLSAPVLRRLDPQPVSQ